MSERKAFKEYFDQSAAEALAGQIKQDWKQFDTKTFVKQATKNLDSLEMMDRVKKFSDALQLCLPSNVSKALTILQKSLPEELPDCENVTDGFLQWPLGQFVASYCVDEFEASMTFMYELTKRFSSEFAVRPFVEKYPQKTFEKLLQWSKDKNPHVRRWCSEGVRPRLPWGKKLHSLIKDPSPIFPILETLKNDPELYVRRSVANNINDIAKDHPDKIVSFCQKWSNDASKEQKWTIRHGLRTLIKQGHPGSLALLGFAKVKEIDAKLSATPKKISLGDSLALSLTLQNQGKKPCKLAIDYRVHFVKKNQSTRPGVFKWTTLEMEPKEKIELKKTHKMRTTTTRTLYPGTHKIDIQINGNIVTETSIILS